MSKTLVLSVCFLISMVSCSRLEPEYLPPRVEANAAPRSSYYGGAPLNYELSNNGDGNYRFSYETDTGISAHESGSPRAAGPEGLAVTAEGGFSYRAPDGQQISISYIADENGFHPTGSHIPTPPPIPEAILRSIELNRQHASNDDGSYNNAVYDN